MSKGKLKYQLIKELPQEERPRERLLKYGAEALANSELLAIVLRSGTKNQSALSLAHKLLQAPDGLKHLATQTLEEMCEINGIGMAKACQIKASIEIGKRIGAIAPEQRPIIKSPADAAALIMEDMRFLDREHFKTMCLNTKNGVLAIETVSIGSLNSSVVHPREVFKNPIKRSSAAIILIHNHPSGDPTPSSEDVAVTKRLIEGGQILGIEVLDHIIIGDNKYLSLKEKCLI